MLLPYYIALVDGPRSARLLARLIARFALRLRRKQAATATDFPAYSDTGYSDTVKGSDTFKFPKWTFL